ncbi:MAG: ribbon-helix-helix domain-containing protein [Chloroflexota bacterium]|nr:ribbon-helix-helix domain-containing protein [Chloroflexota bacterium]
MKARDATDRARVTVYLDYDDLATLDELKAQVRRTERRTVDRSELIRMAVRHLHDEMVSASTTKRGSTR